MFGLGLATAILIDATIVRMVLVPATMSLLGDANWWIPSFLHRRLPTITRDWTALADVTGSRAQTRRRRG
jgi:RND superfamily putative drug exporter